MNTTYPLTVGNSKVELTVAEAGSGRPVLLLHGGAGPISVAGLAARLTEGHGARVLTPIHPGFEGTPRHDEIASIADIARVYVTLLDTLDLTDVTVVGNSIGGWIAAEIALAASPRVGRVVIANAAGLELPQTPIADFFTLTLDEVVELSYCRPEAFRIDVNALPPQRLATMAGNRAALLAYGGASMTDPSLLGRIGAIGTPTLIVWGACDRMIPIEHGRAWAAGIPGAEFAIIEDAGHLPQLETPDAFADRVTAFAGQAVHE